MITGLCAYCRVARATTRDHVVPKHLVRKGHPYSAKRRHALNSVDPALLLTVPTCFACNTRKGTRRLVPPSWEKRIPALDEFFDGTPWRVWMGDIREPAFAEAWV